MDLSHIKLVIWDLDDTLLNGTIAEGNIEFPETNIRLVKTLTDKGILQSICSKNDFENVKCYMESINLWDNFIFPEISFCSKGQSISDIIKKCQLRSSDILFIDDNTFNHKDVLYCNPGINVAYPSIIPQLIKSVLEIKKCDLNHNRVKQYKLLESKVAEKREFISNEEFLKQSNIIVEVSNDCIKELDRIEELVLRTNQLNYTKRRHDRKKILELINAESIETGYIKVYDKYGEYGIVGFYAKNRNYLLDFLFSCRIMGMGVEQWVYSYLNFPNIDIVNDVAIQIEHGITPPWVNEKNKGNIKKIDINYSRNQSFKLLLRGECDLKQVFQYIKSNAMVDTEFYYVSEDEDNKGASIFNLHSEFLKQNIYYDDQKKRRLIESLFFYDKNSFYTKVFNEEYDIIFYSLVSDYRQGMYLNKSNGDIVMVGDYLTPMKKGTSWERAREAWNLNSKYFTKDFYEEFINDYDFIGPITSERLISNLRFLRNKIKKDTLLVLINGVELKDVEFKGQNERDRQTRHRDINRSIEKFCHKSKNTLLMDINKYVVKKDDINCDLMHYRRIIYYLIAQKISEIIFYKSNINLELPNYFIPFIPQERMYEIYKLYDNKKFVIFGSQKRSLVVAKAMRKKCKYVVTNNKDDLGSLFGINIYEPSFLKKEEPKDIYVIVLVSAEDEEEVRRYFNEIDFIEWIHFEVIHEDTTELLGD